VFLHVPVDVDERALRTGVDVTVELIRALVQSGRMKKLAAGP
jgi:pyroglutamyl-peptidase